MADALTKKSRDFYEYAVIKMTYSMVLGALGLYSLSKLCAAGGQSNSAGIQKDIYSGDLEDSFDALESGYGFAAFFYFLAMAFFWGAAIYVSPFITG